MVDDGIGGTITAVSFYTSHLAGTIALVFVLCALVLAISLVWKKHRMSRVVKLPEKRAPRSGGFVCLKAEAWFSGLRICPST